MPKYDLDQIAMLMRQAAANLQMEGSSFAAIQNRGTDAEIAFTLWQCDEGNRETNACDFSKAFGAIVGSCLRNYLQEMPEPIRAHHADHFFDSIQDVLFNRNTNLVGSVDFTQKPANSNHH